ncbi:MAG: hypothetical protein NT029_08935 [Armatimonadetes bacterium]|nr:hypothetical protein [Armatimonadota bacterium]
MPIAAAGDAPAGDGSAQTDWAAENRQAETSAMQAATTAAALRYWVLILASVLVGI